MKKYFSELGVVPEDSLLDGLGVLSLFTTAAEELHFCRDVVVPQEPDALVVEPVVALLTFYLYSTYISCPALECTATCTNSTK